MSCGLIGAVFMVYLQAVHTVVAGVLHDVVDDTRQDLRNVRENFGDDVARLVGGVSKLSNINQVCPALFP